MQILCVAFVIVALLHVFTSFAYFPASAKVSRAKPAIETVVCSTGAQLAAAFANPSVLSVILQKDVKLYDVDWDAYGPPLQLERDLVVESASATTPATLDVSFVRGKVRLRHGVTLTLRNLVFINYRSGAANLAIGFDLLAAMYGNETGVIVSQNNYLVYRTCFPVPIGRKALEQLPPRPARFPGNQSYVLPVSQSADCLQNSTTAPFLDRCYAYVGRYIDIGVPGSDMSSATGRPEPNGYLVHLLEVRQLCMTTMSMECIAAMDPVGCTLYTLKGLPPVGLPEEMGLPAPSIASAAPGAAATALQPAGDEGKGNKRWAIVLGSVFGGVVVVGVVVVAALLVARRRRGQGQAWQINFLFRQKGVEPEKAGDLCGTPGPSASNSHLDDRHGAMASVACHPCRPVPDSELDIRQKSQHSFLAAAGPNPQVCIDMVGQQQQTELKHAAECAARHNDQGEDGGAENAETGCKPTVEAGVAGVMRANEATDFVDGAVHGGLRACSRAGNPQVATTALVIGPAVITLATPHRADLRLDVHMSAGGGSVDPAPPGTNGVMTCIPEGGSDVEAAASVVGSAATSSAVKDGGSSGCNGTGLAAAGACVEAANPAGAGAQASLAAAPIETTVSVVTLLPTVLGKGAFGRVYEGVYQGTRVAVKVVGDPAFGVGVGKAGPPLSSVGADAALQQTEDQQNMERQGNALANRKAQDSELRLRQVDMDAGQGIGPNAGGQGKEVMQGQEGGQGETHTKSGAGLGTVGMVGACRLEGRDQQLSMEREQQPAELSDGHQPAQIEQSPDLDCLEQSLRAVKFFDCRTLLVGSTATWRTDSVQRQQRDDRLLGQFAQEVEVLGRCQHPNVVRLLAACLTPPRLCLVMELMETSLERMIFGGAGGTGGSRLLSLSKVLHIAVQVCQGLAYLHPTIVHRDLKPANVLINGADSDHPVAKIADFGLSRLRTATVPTLTPEAGTPAFQAPECFDVNNNIVTHHADMYSLGVLIWVMLTGQVPWKDLSVVAIACKIVILGERLPLNQLSARRCPPKLSRLIWQCWERDPRRRPAAEEAVKVLLDLQNWLSIRVGSTEAGKAGWAPADQRPDSSPEQQGKQPLRNALLAARDKAYAAGTPGPLRHGVNGGGGGEAATAAHARAANLKEGKVVDQAAGAGTSLLDLSAPFAPAGGADTVSSGVSVLDAVRLSQIRNTYQEPPPPTQVSDDTTLSAVALKRMLDDVHLEI